MVDLTASVSILTGFGLPALIAIIVQPSWSAERKRLATVIVCGIAGVIVAVATGQIEGIPATWSAWAGQVLVAVAVVTATGQGIYLALRDPADKLSAATSPRRAVDE